MKAWRKTALPTTAFVPKPAGFRNRLRNPDGMSDPSFSPEITLLTLVSLNLVIRLRSLSNFRTYE